METRTTGQHASGHRSFSWLIVLSALLLSGCEAPLVLDGVEARRAEPIHRMDRYQAAARQGDNMVVVGNQGVILRSADQGAQWQRQVLAGWPALIDVTACPNGHFVALAYDKTIYVSADQGASWTEKSINNTEETPQAIACAPDGKLWIVGSFAYVWSSPDEGESWTESSSGEDAILTTVQFFDADNGIVTGEFGTVMRTTDSGENWDLLAPLPDEFYPEGAYFSDAEHGWVVGLGGTVLYTSDGGDSWVQQPTGTQVSLFSLEAQGDALYAVGGEGTMLRYADGRWVPVDHGKPVRLYLRVLQALDSGRLLIGGIAGALHIFDPTGA